MGEVRDHFIGIAIGTLLFAAGILIITNISTGHSTDRDSSNDPSTAIPNLINQTEFTNFQNNINTTTITNISTRLNNDLTKLTPALKLTSIITLPIAFITIGWDSIKFIIGSFGLLTTPLTALTGYLGIPIEVVGFITAILLFVLIFAVLGMIFGKDF